MILLAFNRKRCWSPKLWGCIERCFSNSNSCFVTRLDLLYIRVDMWPLISQTHLVIGWLGLCDEVMSMHQMPSMLSWCLMAEKQTHMPWPHPALRADDKVKVGGEEEGVKTKQLRAFPLAVSQQFSRWQLKRQTKKHSLVSVKRGEWH